MTEQVEDFLAHFGRKGMRWGVRQSKGVYDPYPEETQEPTKTQHIQARAFLSSDKHPTEIDRPVHPNDSNMGSGVTSHGHDYAHYRAGSAGKKIFYVKYATGEKSYSIDDLGHDIYLTKEGKVTADIKAYSEKVKSMPRQSKTDRVIDVADKITTGMVLDNLLHHTDISDDEVSAFLAHHGVKGMRWGVRRADRGGGEGVTITNSKGKESEGGTLASGISKKLAKTGTVITETHPDGTVKTMIKKKDGSWQETYISADAQRTIHTLKKEPHEMSDREIKEAINRAKNIEEYQKYFSTDSKTKEMQSKYDQLSLEKKYSQLHREMNPSTRAKVAGLIAASAGTYKTIHKYNKETDDSLLKMYKKMFGGTTTTSASASAKAATAAGAAFKVNPAKVKFRPSP